MTTSEMATKHVKAITATWQGRSMVFAAEAEGKPPVVVDGETDEGPSPMDTLLIALAGCTGSDVVNILRKKRLDLQGLRIDVVGQRRREEPRRYTAITLRYAVTAPGATEAAVRQAIDLSLEKYCSVTHSLAPDIAIGYELALQA
jgi:putative redox protein